MGEGSMSKVDHKSFVDKCLGGEALLEDIETYIADWHSGTGQQRLSEFLGMTQKEYASWVRDPHILASLIMARTQKRALDEIIEEEG